MVGNRQLVRPRRGHYGLAPALIQRLKADYLLGGILKKYSHRLSLLIPDEVPMGKPGESEVPMGKPPGNQQTHCAAEHQQQLLPHEA